METLWRSTDGINIVDVNNNDNMNDNHLNTLIVKACDGFFMKLAIIPGYTEVLRSECFDVLLKSLKDLITSGLIYIM